MKYLIFGGAGFIGVNFSQRLLEDGHEVIIVDNLSRASAPINLKWIREKYSKELHFIYADLRTDMDQLYDVINSVDVVFHLAAQVAVTTSVINPRLDFDSNILATFNVLELIRNSVSKPILVYASTNKVYGAMDDVAVVEESLRYNYEQKFVDGISEVQPLDFHSPYGCSKGAADQYVKDYARIYGLKTVVMRQSCIYGARQFGIEDQGWVAWFIIASKLGRPITVYGNGKQVRDILHVDDLFNAFQLAVDNIDKCAGEAFNIGGGPSNTLSLLELLNMLEKKLKHPIDFKFGDVRPGDQPIYVSDVNKIFNFTNWVPEVTVNSGVEKLFSWVNSNSDIF